MNGFNCCVLRKLVSISSMRMQVQGVANLVTLFVPDIYLQTFSLSSKWLFLRTNSDIEMVSSGGTLQMLVSLSRSLKTPNRNREIYWDKAQLRLLLTV